MITEGKHEKWPLSRRNQREMSSFVAHELLFDYVGGRLDPERSAALEKHLKMDAELKDEMEKIKTGLRYAEALSHAKVSPALIERINEPETYLSVLLKKTNYEKWPLAVKWGIEALIVLCGFMIFLVVIPWDQALKYGLSPSGREIILAEVVKDPRPEIDQLRDIEKTEKGGFEDEGAKTSVALAPVTLPVTEQTKKASAVPTTKETPSAQVPPPAAVAQPVAAPPALAATKKAGEGGLYRGTLRVTNLPVTGPKIIERIEQLGGRKAGEVELGWKKTPSSAYFHFTMPEAKYQELLDSLGDYGKPQLQKEKHPRVMPDGIIRLILTVEEAPK